MGTVSSGQAPLGQAAETRLVMSCEGPAVGMADVGRVEKMRVERAARVADFILVDGEVEDGDLSQGFWGLVLGYLVE